MEQIHFKEISGSSLYAAIWVEFTASTVVIILRIYSQAFIQRKVAIDDVLMFAAWGFQLAASIVSTFGTAWGMGTKTLLLDYEHIMHVLKYGAFAMPVGALSSMCGRIGFICFLLLSVITVYRYRKWLLWVLIVTQLIVNVVPIIMEFTTCKPVSKLWEVMGPGICKEAEVVQKMGYFQGGFNAFTDLLLTVLAMIVIVNLKMRKKTKITLATLLSLSLVAMIAAILKTVALKEMKESDLSYAYGKWTVWNLTEGTVVIITASIPRLRPLLVLIKKKGSELTSRNNYYSGKNPGYSSSRDYHQRYPRRITAQEIASVHYLPRWPEPGEFQGLVEKGAEDLRAIPLEHLPSPGDMSADFERGRGRDRAGSRGLATSRNRRSLWGALHLPGGRRSSDDEGNQRLEIWQRTQISVQVNRMDAAGGAGL